METTRFIGTSDTVGAAIRDERKAQNLTQAQLAKKANVSRSFLIELEEGHPGAALGRVLNVFGALELNPSVGAAPERVSVPASPRRRTSAAKGSKRSAPAARKPGPEVEVEQTLAVIEKGQQLAGHFPSEEAMDRTRRVLEGRTTLTGARAELAAKYGRQEK